MSFIRPKFWFAWPWHYICNDFLSSVRPSSGKSPFLDDSDDETTSNIHRCDFSFPNEYFATVSNEAKDLIRRCLLANSSVNPTNRRATATACLESPWLRESLQHTSMAKVRRVLFDAFPSFFTVKPMVVCTKLEVSKDVIMLTKYAINFLFTAPQHLVYAPM